MRSTRDQIFLVPTLRVGMVFGRTAASDNRPRPRSRDKFHEAEHPDFFTGTLAGWRPVVTRPECVCIIFDP